MAVRIRLRRLGRKKKPHYRVVVTDRAAPREGRFIETLGHYRPLMNPARLVLDLERVDYWIGQGAVPSETVHSLIEKARKGGDDSLAIGDVNLEEERARKTEALAAKREAEAAKAAASVEARVVAAEETAPVEVEEEAAEETAAVEAKEEAAEETAAAEAEVATDEETAAVEAKEAEAQETAAQEGPDEASGGEGDAEEEADSSEEASEEA